MKIVNPSAQITQISGDLQTIEHAARTCYKSEDRITHGSAERLVGTLIDRGHHAMLEFVDVTVRFITDRGIANEIVRHRIASYAQESTRYVSSSSKSDMSKFELDTEAGICDAYIVGNSMKNISDNTNLTEWDVRKTLNKNDIEIRGLTNDDERDNHFFEKIDSSEKAYLLGIIQTDRNGTNFTITQHKEYYWYIDILCHIFSDYVSISDERNSKAIQIGSKKIVEDLINIGIVPNKIKEQTHEDVETLWKSIPSKYKNSFIRGLIDGDGWVRYFVQEGGSDKSCNIGVCSANERLIDLIIDLIKEKFAYICEKSKNDNIFSLIISDYNKSIEIGNWLYEDFAYPFGHPKKSSAWIDELKNDYPLSDFGDEKFKIIIPTFVKDSNSNVKYAFYKFLWSSEKTYKDFRNMGLSPQEARSVLPLCLKTEIIMKTNLRSWRNFFELRTSPAAHPEMRRVTIPLLEEFKKQIPIIFDDIITN